MKNNNPKINFILFQLFDYLIYFIIVFVILFHSRATIYINQHKCSRRKETDRHQAEKKGDVGEYVGHIEFAFLRGLNGLKDFQVTLDVSIYIILSSQQSVNTPTSAIFKSFSNLPSRTAFHRGLLKNSLNQFNLFTPACEIRYCDRCCQRRVNAYLLN